MVNLMQLKAGDRVRLRSGTIGEVTDNMGDGIWVQVRLVSDDAGQESDSGEELVHCEEIVVMAD